MDQPPPTDPALPPPAPGTPPPLPKPPRFGLDFLVGLLAVPGLAILVVVPLIQLLVGPAVLALFAFGLVAGISHKRWGYFLGSLTFVLGAILILFVVCLVNPPNFR